MQDGVELRVLRWWPESAPVADPLVFVAGWVSVVEGWRPLLEVLVVRRPVIYIETREKHSARIDHRRLRVAEFTIPRLAHDLVEIVSALRVNGERALWFGSSMGSNAILEGLKHGRLPARAAFLVGPNAGFVFPAWGRPVLYAPAWIYHVVRPFILWYIRRFRVDAEAEPEQMRRYVRTLNAADPLRLKLSARAVVDYRVWSGLDTVAVPVAIAYAPTDTLHSEHEVKDIVSAMPTGRTVECPSNTYMHEAAVLDDIERFEASLDG